MQLLKTGMYEEKIMTINNWIGGFIKHNMSFEIAKLVLSMHSENCPLFSSRRSVGINIWLIHLSVHPSPRLYFMEGDTFRPFVRRCFSS